MFFEEVGNVLCIVSLKHMGTCAGDGQLPHFPAEGYKLTWDIFPPQLREL